MWVGEEARGGRTGAQEGPNEISLSGTPHGVWGGVEVGDEGKERVESVCVWRSSSSAVVSWLLQ